MRSVRSADRIVGWPEHRSSLLPGSSLLFLIIRTHSEHPLLPGVASAVGSVREHPAQVLEFPPATEAGPEIPDTTVSGVRTGTLPLDRPSVIIPLPDAG
jgi:hypothetical protein